MLPLPAYYAVLAACCAYVFLRGGAPEKYGIAIVAVGSVLSLLAAAASPMRFGAVEVGVFLVDLAALIAFGALALLADRLWPLWVTGMQLVAIAGHGVKLVDSHVIRLAYAFILAIWVYPMLLLIVLGAWNHQRRLARFGVDRSWANSFVRSGRRPADGRIV